MCYGSCKFERLDGECKNVHKYPKIVGAACNTNFICEQCGDEFGEEFAGDEDATICIDCFTDRYTNDETFDYTAAKSLIGKK